MMTSKKIIKINIETVVKKTVGKDYVKPLIRTGEAEKHNEVDHCDVRTTWSLK